MKKVKKTSTSPFILLCACNMFVLKE